MSAIETVGLTKHYAEVQALKGVDLDVRTGEIYGLLGQNGAGKSTLIKVLLGIVKKTSGDAIMLGQPAGDTATRRRVGYLPEDHRFPEYHTGESLLDFYGQLYGISRNDRRTRIDEVLELVGISGRRSSKIRTYSKGMKQRLGIAQAIFHKPDLIILDEPTDGVDPIGRREIRDTIGNLRTAGATVFLNSHLLGEVEQLCDRVGILQRGEKVREGDIASLTETKGVFLIELAIGDQFPEAELRAQGLTVERLATSWQIGLKNSDAIDDVIRMLVSKGLRVRHLVEKRVTLEEVFMTTVESSEPGVDKARKRPRREGRR